MIPLDNHDDILATIKKLAGMKMELASPMAKKCGCTKPCDCEMVDEETEGTELANTPADPNAPIRATSVGDSAITPTGHTPAKVMPTRGAGDNPYLEEAFGAKKYDFETTISNPRHDPSNEDSPEEIEVGVSYSGTAGRPAPYAQSHDDPRFSDPGDPAEIEDYSVFDLETGEDISADVANNSKAEDEVQEKIYDHMEEAATNSKYDRDYDDRDYDDLYESEGTSKAVTGAIIRRIAMQHPDVLSKYGPEAVLSAVEDRAMHLNDLEEIGSSDISAWTKDVLRDLESHGTSHEIDDKAVDTLAESLALDWQKTKLEHISEDFDTTAAERAIVEGKDSYTHNYKTYAIRKDKSLIKVFPVLEGRVMTQVPLYVVEGKLARTLGAVGLAAASMAGMHQLDKPSYEHNPNIVRLEKQLAQTTDPRMKAEIEKHIQAEKDFQDAKGRPRVDPDHMNDMNEGWNDHLDPETDPDDYIERMRELADIKRKKDKEEPAKKDDEKVDEVITKKTPAGDIISDFMHSKNKKFSGDSAAQRKKRALGAYYGMRPEKSNRE